MIQAVIFDMDGVLIDSVSTGLRIRTKVLAEHGVDLALVPDPMNEQHKGTSAKNLLAAVQQHTGKVIELETYKQRGIDLIVRDLRASNVTADPELVRFLDELVQHHVPLAIASSGLRPTVTSKLDILGLTRYFSVIVTGSEVIEHKPAPDTYLQAAAQLGVNPTHCVAFEDSSAGTASASSAGCKVVGFTKYNDAQKPLPNTVLTVQNWQNISFTALQQL